jgi:hypothetical protein
MSVLRRRHYHDARDAAGRYAHSSPCEACGKPAGANYYSDDETLASGSPYGLVLCGRKRCVARREKLSVQERIDLYRERKT